MKRIFFHEIFDISKQALDSYGAFDISLTVDLPLFIDPFLLFNSNVKVYKKLHKEIIKYLRFLKVKSVVEGTVTKGALSQWYVFPEVKQNWLGFSFNGNSGRGLKYGFAKALNDNLGKIFTDFSQEVITEGSHLEKLCLIKEGVGRDSISDFITNLIKDFLLTYTEQFAIKYISKSKRQKVNVSKTFFNYETESWVSKVYDLPIYNNDFVILTPKDLLTKDDIWINRKDLLEDFRMLPYAVTNEELRSKINNYFNKQLAIDNSKKGEKKAIENTLVKFPILVDYYIQRKEKHGESAMEESNNKVWQAENFFISNVGQLISLLREYTTFFEGGFVEEKNSYNESLRRAKDLKHVVENQDGYKLFYDKDGIPVGTENDLQIAFQMVCSSMTYDINREPNNGRGPADFVVSKGAKDKTVVEMKLASNSKLKQNLEKQAEIYAVANKTSKKVKVIMFFTEAEQERLITILKGLKIYGEENIVIIDARDDNKVSASKVK